MEYIIFFPVQYLQDTTMEVRILAQHIAGIEYTVCVDIKLCGLVQFTPGGGGGGDSHMKRSGMLVGNFCFDP